MSESDRAIDYEIVDVDVSAWVNAARADPTQHRDRQVAETVLVAIGLAPNLKDTLILKGGAAMALAFQSSRQTGDIDFTSTIEPHGFAENFVSELNPLLSRAAIQLGHLDLICRVQTIKMLPKPSGFEEHKFPALLIRIGSAKRGTKEEQKLAKGIASRVLDLEISFRDQVYAYQQLNLVGAGVAVRAFTMHELIAEKMRALLQQPVRKRYRRQDVYDIAYLIDDNDFSGADKAAILATLIEKCRSRDIDATQESMGDPDIKRRAAADWNTLALEVSDLPTFEERFALIHDLYVSLPWDAHS